MQVKVLKKSEPCYPLCIKDNPEYLDIHYIGELSNMNNRSVVIVGSRECTEYGIKVTRDLVNYLVKNKIVIITGLASGIDSCASRSALEYDGITVGF